MLPADWLIFTSHDTFALQFPLVKDAMESVYIGLLDIVYEVAIGPAGSRAMVRVS